MRVAGIWPCMDRVVPAARQDRFPGILVLVVIGVGRNSQNTKQMIYGLLYKRMKCDTSHLSRFGYNFGKWGRGYNHFALTRAVST